MVPGRAFQGRRIADAASFSEARPCDYAKIEHDGLIEWWARDPAGVSGRLIGGVTEYADGTITVSRKIAFDAWRGWLSRGIWRSA